MHINTFSARDVLKCPVTDGIAAWLDVAYISTDQELITILITICDIKCQKTSNTSGLNY